MKITRASTLAALLLIATEFYAQITIHVPADRPTVQAAIDAAGIGDTVLVSDGTYFEHIDFKGKAITVTSVNGSGATILDGQLTTVPVVTMQTGEPSTAVLKGFTVRNGAAGFGSGAYLLGASPTIVNNIFESNFQGGGGFGAGIGGNSASPDIERNLFRNNTCDSQWLSGVISFVNSSSPIISNNVIVGNSCRGINLTLPVGNIPVVNNNTIVGNPVGIRVDARVSTAQQLYENNIVAGNTIGLQVDFLVSGNEPAWKHNLLFNNTSNYSGIADQTGLNSNLIADPQFVNSPLDLHLLSDSPAIDAGENSVPRLAKQDYDGQPRIIDGKNLCAATVDLGALEYQAAPLASWGAASLSFGAQLLNTSSSPQSMTLNNTGATCLQISGYPLSGDFSAVPSCGAALPAGQSCNVSVTFSPTAVGARTGTLSLASNSPVAPSVALSGSGVTPVANLSSALLTFSGRVVGTGSAVQNLTVSNSGGATLHISSIAASGDFSQSNNCGSSVLPGGSCTIGVVFTPSAAGARSGSVVITDDAYAGTQQSATLSGVGLDYALSGSPASVTISAGLTASYTVSVTGQGGSFPSAVSLTCSGLPVNSSCSFSPPSLGPGIVASTSTMKITTTAPKGKRGGTPSGTRTITISGSSGALLHSTAVTLIVK